jgi:hypothetical protein
MSAFHTGIHQRYVMKVDPAAASLRGQHTEQKTITEYMIFEFTAYTATSHIGAYPGWLEHCSDCLYANVLGSYRSFEIISVSHVSIVFAAQTVTHLYVYWTQVSRRVMRNHGRALGMRQQKE